LQLGHPLAAKNQGDPPIVTPALSPFIPVRIVDPIHRSIVPDAAIQSEVRLGPNRTEQQNPTGFANPSGAIRLITNRRGHSGLDELGEPRGWV